MAKPASGASSFRFGLFEAEVAHGRLTRNGVRVKIQDQPFRVLVVLLQRAGEIVSREELRTIIWPEGTFVDFDGSLNVILKKLRAALDDNPDNPRFIETVPRRGYRFIAPVTVTQHDAPVEASLSAPDSLPSLSPDPQQPAPHKYVRRARGPMFVWVGLLVLLIAGIAEWIRWGSPNKSAAASTAPLSSALNIRKSVAVLGFQSISDTQKEAWLGTALSEMLSTELAGGDNLRLVSAEDVANLHAYSPWAHGGTLDQATTSRIGVALGSDLIVLGSYTTIGKPEHSKLRVDARLQDCKSGEVLSEVAEIGAAEDLFAIVSRIGGKLRHRMGVPSAIDSDDVLVLSSLPTNAEAARFYSLGLERLRSYDFPTARGLFEQAVAAEPKFPLAHSMLSRTDLFLGEYDQAKTEAKEGLDLASGLPRVQRMQIEASYHQAMGDRGKAAENYRVLFNLFPDSLEYGIQLAKLQVDSYHPEEALETIRRLRQLPAPYRDDPLIDLREGMTIEKRDQERAVKLLRTAAQKSAAQDKKFVYAKAEQTLCWLSPEHLSSPPECNEAYDTYSGAGNQDAAASTLQLMAENQRLTGHDAEAEPLYQKASRTFIEMHDYESAGVALNNLSLVYENRGQFALAEQQYLQAKKYFESVNDRINEANAIGNVADLEAWRGNFHAAGHLYEQSWGMLDAAQAAQSQYPHIQNASLLLMQGQLGDATAEITAQISSLRKLKSDPWQTANALTTLGEIQRHQADLESAQKSFEEAIQILKDVNASTASNQVNEAELSIDRGRFKDAERQLRDAISALQKDKDTSDEFRGYLALARALLAQSNITEARAAVERARALLDVRAFPVYSLPLDTLALRVKAATAPAGTSGRELLLSVQRDLKTLVHRAHQIGFYTAECEARLALGEVGLRLSPAVAKSDLSTLGTEALNRGFRLYSTQASAVGAHAIPQTLASNKPSR